MKRHQLVWDMIKIHVSDGPFFMGSVANYPQVMVIKTDLKNVPRKENLAQGGHGESLDPPHPGGLRPGVLLLGQPRRAQLIPAVSRSINPLIEGDR